MIKTDSVDDFTSMDPIQPDKSVSSLHSSKQRRGSGSLVASSSSRPSMARSVSSPLVTIPERPVTPPNRPRYIHRRHTAKGTRFVLQSRSPSGGTPNSLPHSSDKVDLSLTGIVQEDYFGGTVCTQQSGDREDPFPQHVDRPDEVAMSSKRKGKQKVVDANAPLLPAANLSQSASRTGHHKRSRGNTLMGNEEEFADSNPLSKSGIVFASSQQEPEGRQLTKAEVLRNARLPTIKPGPFSVSSPPSDCSSAAHGDIPILAGPAITEAESPIRPSFDSDSYTPEELSAYAQMRLAFAAATVFERAATTLTSLYRNEEWPAHFPGTLTSTQNSSFIWAKEAAQEFRSEAKKHPVYRKFQTNGNDIGTRARNDVAQTGGDLDAIRRRIEEWERVDHEEGVGEIRLVNRDESRPRAD